MVGNDVIDINQTKQDSNWKRSGFVEKIFNNEEQITIEKSPNPFNTVWRMWSMKESAYKIYLQQGKARSFYPTKINCKIISLEKGFVSIDNTNIYTQTISNEKYIFTSASLDDLATVESQIFHLSSNDVSFQSKQTHQQILQYIAQKNQLESSQLSIKKTPTNIPEIFHKGKKLNISFSLTHHGHFGAFSISTPQLVSP